MNNRIDVLKGILAQKPDDAFARYGLAMEYLKLGRAEDAVAEFRALIAAHPDYSYAYYHGGQAYEKLGRVDDAREIYRLGIERAPDAHARSEIQAALDLLPT
jgi:tetratricopeptide (TPR) repeat protein